MNATTKLAAVLMSIVSGAAMADEGVYAFADVGQTSYGSISQTAMSPRIGGGYNFIEPIEGLTVGVEGAYADFGSASGSVATGFGYTTTQLKTTGLMAAGVATWKIPNVNGLSVLAKVGMMSAKTNATVITSGGAVFSYSATTSGNFVGIGVMYDFNEHLAVRGQYEDFGNAATYGANSSGLSRLSAGVVYNF